MIKHTLFGAVVSSAFLLAGGLVSAQGLPLPDNSHDPGATAPGFAQKGGAGKEKSQDSTKKKPKRKQKGWLGIALKVIKAKDAKVRGYDHPLVRVESIFGGSPAEASGFQPDDVVLEVDGTRIKSSKQLVGTIGGHGPGDKVQIKLLRGKEIVEVPLLLGMHPGRYGLLKSRFLNKPAPDFKVKEAKGGKAISLASMKGDIIVIDFWATWCGPCRKAIPKLNKLQTDMASKGVRVLGISDEDQSTVQKFMGKTEVGYTLACDKERASNKSYLVSALPTLFVIDHNGVVRDVHIGAGKFGELRQTIDTLITERDAKK